MASKALWTGSCVLGPGLTLNVEATKATDKYAGAQPLKEVCACHLKPYVQERKCAVSGELRGAQGTKTGMVKAVEKPDGSYVRVDESTITAAMPKELQALAAIPLAEVPMYAISELWRLRPAKKVPGSEQGVAFALAWLQAREKALMARFPYLGHEHVVAIHALPDGTLGMNRLRYTQELREAEPEHLAHKAVEVPERALAILDMQLEELPTNFSLAETEDASVAERAALIAQILGGETPTPVAEAEPQQSAPDLMAVLEASMAGRPAGAKKKQTKAKAGAKAPANA